MLTIKEHIIKILYNKFLSAVTDTMNFMINCFLDNSTKMLTYEFLSALVPRYRC